MGYPRYTPEQEKFINENYPKYRRRGEEFTALYNSLYNPPRTLDALRTKARSQFTHPYTYTKPQDDFLREHERMGRKELTELFNMEFGECRPVGGIRSRCINIGLHKCIRFTDEEADWLMKYYGVLPSGALFYRFEKRFGTDHSRRSISQFIYRRRHEQSRA